MTIAALIATVGGVGYLRPGPGTWGSLAALPLAYGLHWLGGFPFLAAATFVVLTAGTWATHVMTKGTDNHDPSEIVVDEVVGQWIAIWAVSLPAWAHGIDVTALWPGWISAFVLFRLFDIWKPGPVGWMDRREGPVGVMMDDVVAGFLAAIGSVVLAALFHLGLGM